MKRAKKSSRVRRLLPLVWRDYSWSLSIKVRPQPSAPREETAASQRGRGTFPFSPFRGFYFSQLAVQKI